MKQILFITLCLFSKSAAFAQVGINTSLPLASLQIDAKNSINPESGVGLGVPVIDQFPKENPTKDQHGMLIYLRNTQDTNAEGYYYWDGFENHWEYIVDFKSMGLDTSKTIVSGTQFTPNNMGGVPGVDSRIVPFSSINSLDPSFILSSGGLKVGKTSIYYLSFSGGVSKSADNFVYSYKTEILINGISNSNLTSTNSAPGGAQNGRSATFYIASIISLQKDDVITIKTTKTAGQSSIISVDTPYTLTLINMN
ncbi:hypothetical protein HX001_03010 [Empedobacter brevis]|uniref:C1q domain-containing protein n=2 Tax=Empedobacter brevis TaxID=247 RepID=A0A511NIS4_9FLAO|nr:hypothetical protein [Empedobacter brevis]MDM1071460.1 hypothetical protein [Empedobacter brevis]QHC85615.1 hypothetical protein AS589_12865 [Empedobacter brevis]GEM52720.1 hypothetical protein EB1_25100 [Empedobacter brevis NBRC 14943 = ATCC 43319]